MMAFECGIDKEDLQKTMLPRLEPKVIYSEGWVFIKNFSRYHTGGLNAEKGRKAAIEALPERIRAKVSLIEKKEAGKNNPLEGGAPFASASASTSTYIVASATEAFSFQKEIKKLEDSPHRYMNIIALYLENRKPDIRDSKQLSAAIKRHCKPAKILEVYADDQLIKAFKKSREVTPEWTLETVIKILTK